MSCKLKIYWPLLLAAFLFICPAAQAEGMKVAVVDIDKVLNESKAGKSIQKQLSTRREAFQKEFSKRENDLMTAQKSLAEKKKELSTEEFQKQRQKFEKKLLETRNLFQKRRNSLDKALSIAFAQLRKNIIEVTASIADKNGFNLVLTRDSVVIVQKEMEITDKVLESLNSKIDHIKLDVAE